MRWWRRPASTEVGAQVAWHSIMHKKHVVMLNVETDVTVGLMLSRMAEQAGCVYTASTGDEPGVCKQLYDFASTLGFEVVCLGKGKNNAINYYANPDTCRAEAERKNMNPKMLAAFKDGTKTMVELAAMANATGLVPDVPGCHGAKVDRGRSATRSLCRKADGGILSRRGCVDYSIGKVAPGVFVIVTSDDAHTRADLKFYSMGDGPYYTLYRPFHLCSIETPQAVAEAVIYGESVLKPQGWWPSWSAWPSATSRRGRRWTASAASTSSAASTRREEAKALHGIPMGLTPGGRVLKDVARGELLTERQLCARHDRIGLQAAPAAGAAWWRA